MSDLRRPVSDCLKSFTDSNLRTSAIDLLKTLGYASDRTVNLASSSPDAFLEFVRSHAQPGIFNESKALCDQWQSAELLFQLTDQELSKQRALFDDKEISPSLLRSYLFFAIELSGDNYARGKLTDIARQINRVFPMPVMLILKHRSQKQPVISIAVINRRQSKIDAANDVLGKVTIIRDISIDQPHRGHLDILNSIALENLEHPQRLPINNFDNLHTAWEEIFNVDLLNKRFYRELANWYFWALPQVEFPNDAEKDSEKRRATSLIRLLTRLIFCWFLKEKGLIPESLFNETDLQKILKELKPDSCSYHQAILQNLFFGTLNQQMGNNPKTKKPWRQFAKDEGFQKNKSTYGVDNLFRYEEQFRDPDTAIDHFADIPFLNGGLFECLDRTETKTKKKIYIDGFSRNKNKRPNVPNELFFSDELSGIDLSDAYGERSRRNEKVRGLIRILNSYKFTIVENTPIDQEIALDPELLGKVFENLLASYNEETKTTARKQTGSFYTPRPIVEYMVDESLKAHLSTALVASGMSEDKAKSGMENLFAYTEEPHPFSNKQVDTLLDAIHTCKILDPACGSGAFPMGMLQKLVYIIHKLDPDNAKWMQLQIDKASEIPDSSSRDAAIKAIEQDFADNEDDYGRKLYLIENCLYGVDIQPIAIQISKLRFFISLVCDQKTNRRKKDNHGIRPLPNLETKFVAADTLIALKKDSQLELFESAKVKKLESELQRVRHDHFAATTRQKKLALQDRDRAIRDELAKELEHEAFWDQTTARKLADWDPYDPQASADYFEPLWMFDRSLAKGFDIVIGNPPYVRIQNIQESTATYLKGNYIASTGKFDIYVIFIERSFHLIRDKGIICFIHPHRFLTTDYGRGIKKYLDSNRGLNQATLFGVDQVFGAATTYTGVFIYSQGNEEFQFRHTDVDEFQTVPFNCRKYADSGRHWSLSTENNSSADLLDKIRGQEQRLSNICDGIYQGVISVGDDIFVIQGDIQNETLVGWSHALEEDVKIEAAAVRPLLKGENIQRYIEPESRIWMIYPHFSDMNGKTKPFEEKKFRENCPKAYDYLRKFKSHLSEKKIRYKTNPKYWYSLHRPRQISIFEQCKILTPQLQNKPSFAIDQNGWFPDAGGYSIVLKNKSELEYNYLLGVLNSSVLWYFIKGTSNPYNNSYYYFKTKYLEPFSIPAASATEKAAISLLVDSIRTEKQLNHLANTEATEREIDERVYRMYELTKNEIKIIEEYK